MLELLYLNMALLAYQFVLMGFGAIQGAIPVMLALQAALLVLPWGLTIVLLVILLRDRPFIIRKLGTLFVRPPVPMASLSMLPYLTFARHAVPTA